MPSTPDIGAYQSSVSIGAHQAIVAAAIYSVTYDGNTNDSGTVPTDATAYSEGDMVTVLGNTGSLAKTGYTFSGWNTAANGTGTGYVATDTFLMGTANVTLYAVWTEDTTVTVTTNVATEVNSRSAILQGSLTDLGGETSVSVYFEYGTTTAYGSTTDALTLSETGNFSAKITDFDESTTYHFRAVASDGGTAYNGADESLTTTACLFELTGTPSLESIYWSWSGVRLAIGEYEYTGACFNVELDPGTYQLEAWGAQGCSSYLNEPATEPPGGLGGYAQGTITLTETTVVRVCIGQGKGEGIDAYRSSSMFNGGGDGDGSYGGGGGGATDFRIGGTDLLDRVLVAGGGGGASRYGYGGDGGGLIGSSSENGAGGGTQVAGGASGNGGVAYEGDPHGVFGFGGDAIQDIDNMVRYGAGGGGGWYGGGAGRGGGGGSSYIDGVDSGTTQTGINAGYGKAKITKIG